jgi:LPXTG-motif cell wall-anchored protein
MSRGVLVAMAVCATAGAALAQQSTTTSAETKTFEVLAVDGNRLDVRLPEGTRELTVTDDFRFTVDGQQLSVQELKPGMKGTATITTRTTVVPVTATEVTNGTIVVRTDTGIIVRTSDGMRSFQQGDLERGVTIVRDGNPVGLSELREGDSLTATIITQQPPKIMTEREVNATLASAQAAATSGAQAVATSGRLPQTASSWPLFALAGALSLGMGLALRTRRRVLSGPAGNGVLVAIVLCSTAVAAPAQQSTTTSSEAKTFEVLAVDGNRLDVRLPEGTRELTVPDDFRFTVDGQQLSVQQLKPGMKGTATITTRTTVVPVTVTEVKNGTVMMRSGSSLIVRTDEGIRSFTQGDVDKRGVKIIRAGKPAQLSEFREGDVLSATIITSQPPKVLTEREVNATLAAAAPEPAPPAPPAALAPPAVAQNSPASAEPAPVPTSGTLPQTAGSWPLLVLGGVLSIGAGLGLAFRRRAVR